MFPLTVEPDQVDWPKLRTQFANLAMHEREIAFPTFRSRGDTCGRVRRNRLGWSPMALRRVADGGRIVRMVPVGEREVETNFEPGCAKRINIGSDQIAACGPPWGGVRAELGIIQGEPVMVLGREYGIAHTGSFGQ